VISVDEQTIKSLALFLNLSVHDSAFSIPRWKLEEAGQYWAEEEEKILEEAERLQQLKMALRKKDPKGTIILLEELGIEDTNPLDDELQSLSVDIAGAVEKLSENSVEISFDLGSYSDIQRTWLGVPGANTLLVRLYLDYARDMPTAFCVHTDTDFRDDNEDHTPWVRLADISKLERAGCTRKISRFVWQISRMLHRELKGTALRIENIHNLVKQKVGIITKFCVVCGVRLSDSTKSQRPVPCLSC
jgi:hypothetical protein